MKKWGVTDFVLERTCPEEHLNLSKSGFVREEGQSEVPQRISSHLETIVSRALQPQDGISRGQKS